MSVYERSFLKRVVREPYTSLVLMKGVTDLPSSPQQRRWPGLQRFLGRAGFLQSYLKMNDTMSPITLSAVKFWEGADVSVDSTTLSPGRDISHDVPRYVDLRVMKTTIMFEFFYSNTITFS